MDTGSRSPQTPWKTCGRQRIARREAIVGLCIMSLGSLASCGFRQAAQEASATQSAIKNELGIDSNVTFTKFTGTKGTRLIVVVRLRGKPAGDAIDLKSKIQDIVRRNFTEHVERVDLMF